MNIQRHIALSERGVLKGDHCIIAAIFFFITSLSASTMAAESRDATEATRQAHAAVLEKLPFDDRDDFADAARGLIDEGPAVIKNEEGITVWDMNQYAFLEGEENLYTVNPSLRRVELLNNHRGLFKVADRVYQVRGFDLANMGIVVGDSGYIIIDPLTSVDTARAALELVHKNLGERPVTAVIYSHSHVDHFGGVRGVLAEEVVAAGRAKVIAPVGFMEEAVSENIYAGNAMTRRAQYMFGPLLPRGPQGQVGAGLGKSTPRILRVSLIGPTHIVDRTGQEMTVDGVRIIFQNVPGTEAPANMNFHFPELGALYMADNAVSTLHNLLTPRGSQVRDARAWSAFNYEAIRLFGDSVDVVFMGHNWPRWGRDQALDFLRKQADMYKYIHDQTLRLANHGLNMDEIAETISLPDELGREWYNRSYYATVGWNAKAVYQYYLGWFDGNPANYNPIPPVAAARKYVEYMGGAEEALMKARTDFERGEYRWVLEVLKHLVYADSNNREARLLKADAMEQLGYQEESAVFRNFYLMGAKELRQGIEKPFDSMPPAPDLFQAVTLDMIFDGMAVRLNGPRAAGRVMTIGWHFTDTDEKYTLYLRNGVLRHSPEADPNADVTLTLTRALLNDIVASVTAFPAELQPGGGISHEGELPVFGQFVGLLDTFDLWWNVVTR